MLGLHTVPDVSCAILVVGMGPKVVAHMHPGASAILLVQPWIALGLLLVTLVKVRDRCKWAFGDGGGQQEFALRGGSNSRGLAIEWCGGITLYLAWACDLVGTATVA